MWSSTGLPGMGFTPKVVVARHAVNGAGDRTLGAPAPDPPPALRVEVARHLDHGSTKPGLREQTLRAFVPLRGRQHDLPRAARVELVERRVEQHAADAAPAKLGIDDDVLDHPR